MKRILRFSAGLILASSLLLTTVSRAYAFDAEGTFKARCTACHSIGEGKKVGPDLKDVTERRDEAWLLKFIKSPQAMFDAKDPTALKLLSEHNNVPMPNHEFDDDQIKAILAYITSVSKGEVPTKTEEQKPEASNEENKKSEDKKGAVISKLDTKPPFKGDAPEDKFNLYIWIACLIVLVGGGMFLFSIRSKCPDSALADPKKATGFLLVLALAVILGGNAVKNATRLGYSKNYQPQQPIEFSHKLHAGTMQINCQYCHAGASKSRHAGIPSASVCMNCHRVAKVGMPEIDKIWQAVEKNEPIEWIKIHNLPDHVYFNHSQHVVAGQISCQTCHGPVEEMSRVYQHAPLNMGWCINCHREEKIKVPGPFQGKTVAEAGGINCVRCHY